MFDRKLWTLAKKNSIPLIITLLLGGSIGGLVVIQAWLISQIVGRVFIDGEKLFELHRLLVQLIIIILVRAGMVFGREVSAGYLAVAVKNDLREKLFSHLLAIGPALRETERTGELSSTLVQGIEKLDAYFRQYLPQLALSALIPVTILVVVFPMDWLTGLVFLLTAPLIPLFMVLIATQAEKETSRQWILLSRLSSHFQDVLQGLTTLKSFGRSKQQIDSIERVSSRYADTTLKVLRIAFLSALVLELLATLSTAIVAVQIGLRLMYGRMEFIQALFILILAPEFYLPLRQLGASFHSGMDGISASARIYSLLDKRHSGKKSQQSKVFSLANGIQFQDVSYAFESGKRPAINQVSFSLSPGETTVLVGYSGAGKSTIAQMLAGFIHPESGNILVDEQSLSEIEMHTWRQKIGWVPQFPYLFHSSIEENIRLAKPGASRIEVVHAAQQANADGFICNFPAGYRTVLGERGARLSGGQAQRIALARAFLKAAPLIILDEPGANLDLESQEMIQDALSHLLLDKTALIIAHRISTIRRAHQIVVLEKGQVVQTGQYSQLKQQPGHFQKLIRANPGGEQ